MLFSEPLPCRQIVDGAEIEFLREGAGESLVYLHGFDGVSPSDPFIAQLASGFDLIVPSLPGFGASRLLPATRTASDLAHAVVGLIDSLKVKDCLLVGSSFGAWIAAELATMRPRFIRGLVLADPIGARFAKDPLDHEILDIFTIATADYPYIFFADRAKAETAFGGTDFTSMSYEQTVRYCTNREGVTRFGWSPLLYNPSLASRLCRIEIPTLVLWGEQDRVVDEAYGRKFANAIPGADFRTIPDCGHYLPIEQPSVFASEIRQFSERLRRTPA